MKAQVNQAFIWVFAIIVMGGIFLLSYNLIDRTVETGSQADFARFTNTYKNYLLRHDGYGSYQIERILAPTGYDTLCVITPGFGGSSASVLDGSDFIVDQYLSSPSDQDTFLIGQGTTTPIGFFNHTTNHIICFKAKAGMFRIGFEGQGRKVTLVNPDIAIEPTPEEDAS